MEPASRARPLFVLALSEILADPILEARYDGGPFVELVGDSLYTKPFAVVLNAPVVCLRVAVQFDFECFREFFNVGVAACRKFKLRFLHHR